MGEKVKTYGLDISQRESTVDGILEELKINGISIYKEVVSTQQSEELRKAIEEIYEIQKESFGEEKLAAIKELDLIRMPFAFNPVFVDLIRNDLVLNVVRRYIGDAFHLHLQNAVVNRTSKEHHQSSWHRDLPYQNWVCSEALAVNAFVCLSDFNPTSGGTRFIKGSHLVGKVPTQDFLEENSYTPLASAGDLLFFDSMVLHRAGQNTGTFDRFGINQVFTRPFISQQINLPKLLEGTYQEDAVLNQLFGYKYAIAESVDEFRRLRLSRIS